MGRPGLMLSFPTYYQWEFVAAGAYHRLGSPLRDPDCFRSCTGEQFNTIWRVRPSGVDGPGPALFARVASASHSVPSSPPGAGIIVDCRREPPRQPPPQPVVRWFDLKVVDGTVVPPTSRNWFRGVTLFCQPTFRCSGSKLPSSKPSKPVGFRARTGFTPTANKTVEFIRIERFIARRLMVLLHRKARRMPAN